MFQRINKLEYVILFVICMGFLIVANKAYCLTPAGTEIRNQSVATYQDPDGNPYTTTSNEVITTVAAVYSFSIAPNTLPGNVPPGDFTETPALAQEAAPGVFVYYSYYLINTGNASDVFLVKYINSAADSTNPALGTLRIYQDMGKDGKVDPGDKLLISSSDTGDNTFGGNTTTEVRPDTSIALIITYQVPVTSTDKFTIDVDIDGLSNGDPNITDTVSNFSRTTVADAKGVITINKRANVAMASPGDILEYTISGSNTGNAPVKGKDLGDSLIDRNEDGNPEQSSGIFIYDFFSEGLNPGTGSLPNIKALLPEMAPVNAVILYTDGADRSSAVWSTLARIGDNEIKGIALFIPDTNPDDALTDNALDKGQGYQLVFQIPIDDPLSIVTVINKATCEYNDGAPVDPADKEITSNETRTDVPPEIVTGVEIGPINDPYSTQPEWQQADSSMHPKIDDPLTDQPESLEYGNDTYPEGLERTVGDRHAGQAVYFVNTVLNTGEIADSFNIIIDTNDPAAPLPAGYRVLLLKSDGVTPLANTSMNDAIPDTGPLAPGERYNIVVKVIIPGNAGDNPSPKNIVLNAKSVTNPDVIDMTTDQITSVYATSVDMAAHGTVTGLYTGDNNDANDNPVPQISSCPIPEHFDFAIDIENVYPDGLETGAIDTYTLSVDNPLNEWIYEIFKDTNGNGKLDNNEMIPVTNTGNLNPWNGVPDSGEGQSVAIIVRVIPPENAAAGTYNTVLSGRSTLNTAKSDYVEMSISISECKQISIEPDSSRTSVAGGTVTYCHEVTNLGNTTELWRLTYSSEHGYTAVFMRDVLTIGEEAVIGTDYPAINNPDSDLLESSESVEICIKLFIPTDAPVGTDIITVRVADANITIFDEAVDITSIIAGNLELTKVADKDSVEPTVTNPASPDDFHPLSYKTIYKNLGDTEINNLYILDAIPANTRIVTETSATDGVEMPRCVNCPPSTELEYSMDGGIIWFNWTAAPPSAGADHSNTAITHIRWFIGTLSSGSSGEVIFQVLVD